MNSMEITIPDLGVPGDSDDLEMAPGEIVSRHPGEDHVQDIPVEIPVESKCSIGLSGCGGRLSQDSKCFFR